MGHYEFEQMLFTRENLPASERARLEAHLDSCALCSQLSDQWEPIESLLRATPSVSPPEGFSARFLERLENARQRRHARIVLLTTVLTIAGLLAVLGMAGWTFISSGATIFSWALKAINQFYWLGSVVDVIGDTLILFLESLLEQMPMVVLLVISAAISALSLTWITSFYRLSYREIRRE